MCLPPANGRIWPSSPLYSAVYRRSRRHPTKNVNHLRHNGIKNILNKFFTWFQVDHTCLTIDKVNPQLCPNSAPFCHPMSLVNNSALLLFHPSHFHSTNNKFNPL